MSKTLVLLVVVSLLTACSTTASRLSQKDLGAIAVCNGGVESTLHGKLTAAIEKANGVIDATLKDTLKGIMVGDESFNREQKFAAYNAYLECLKTHLSSP